MYAVFILPGTPAAVAQVLPAIASVSVPPAIVAPVPAVPPAVTRAADAGGRRASGASAAAIAGDTVYFEYQVDQQVAVDSMAAPRYPVAQRAANVESEVIAQFVVDTMGRIEPASLRVLRTNHEDFTAAVRDALEAARCKPAMKGGQKVRQVVQMPFMFRLNR